MKEATVSESAVLSASSAQQESLQQNDVLQTENQGGIFFQAKLNIGAPDDPLEKEADTVADKVMRMPEGNFIQRKCSECEKEEKIQKKSITPFIQAKHHSASVSASDDVSRSIQNSKGNGGSLDADTQTFMSNRFDSDFSGVKIHTDSNAIQLSRELNAKAFTVGNDIYFNQSEYQPQSTEGKRLLAHELTHTLQQGENNLMMKSAGLLPVTDAPTSVEIQSEIPQNKNITESQNYGSESPPDDPISTKSAVDLTNVFLQRKCEHCEAETKMLSDITQSGSSVKGTIQRNDEVSGERKEIELSLLILSTDKAPSYFSYLTVMEGDENVFYYCDATIRGGTKREDGGINYNDTPLPAGFYKINRVDGDARTFFIQSENGSAQGYLQFGKIASAEIKYSDGQSLKDDGSFSKLGAAIRKINDNPGGVSFYISYPAAKSDESEQKKSDESSKSDDLGLEKPEWLKKMEQDVEKLWQDDREANAADENIPASIKYYASKGAQASMGEDTWAVSIRYGVEQTEKTYEYVKPSDENNASGVYEKIKKAVEKAKTQKRNKDFDDQLKVGEEGINKSKWAWAYTLKNAIKTKLDATSKLPEERGHSDFPNKLSLVTRVADDESIYLKVWVEVAENQLGDEIEPDKVVFSWRGGSLPTALTKEMTAEQLIPDVRTMAGALRLFDSKKQNLEDLKVTESNKDVLPAFPAIIISKNVRPDATALEKVTSAFDMTLQIDKIFGRNQIDLVTKFANLPVEYHWAVFKIDKQKMQGISDTQLPEQWLERQEVLQRNVTENLSKIKLEEVQDLASMSKDGLGIYRLALPENPLFIYQYDSYKKSMDSVYDFDVPELKSDQFNDYLIYCKAFPQAGEDDKYVRRPSTAFYLLHAVNSDELGNKPVSATPDKKEALKSLIDKTTDEKEKQVLLNQLKEIEDQDKLSLHNSVDKRLQDIKTLLDHGKKLKDFLAKDSADRKKRSTNKEDIADEDPIMIRLLNYENLLAGGISKEHPLLKLFQLIILRYPPPLYDHGYAIDLFVNNLTEEKGQLETVSKQITKSDKHFKDPAQTLRPEVTLVSAEKGGTVFNVLMVLGQAPETSPSEIAYHLIDVSHPQTFKVYRGVSTLYENGNDPEKTRQAAIAEAFDDFAHNNEYGSGDINYRIPPDGKVLQLKSRAGIKKMLEYLAMAAAVTALVLGTIATGGTLGVVAAGIGIGAGVLGAGLAIDNMVERSDRGTFEWDAQTIMDIVSIVGAVFALGSLKAAASGVKAAQTMEAARELYGVAEFAGNSKILTEAGSLALKAGRTIQAIKMINKAMVIYQWTEMFTSVVLIGWKVNQDIERIKKMGLKPEEEDAMIQQAIMEAIQSGAMIMVSAGHGISESTRQKGIDKANGAPYKNMEEKGWVTKEGWTDKAPESVKSAKFENPTEEYTPSGSASGKPKDESVLKGITPQTKDMLERNPKLANLLMENPLAAQALKLCNSPCFPEFATEIHITRLEKVLAELKQYDIEVNMKELKEYFHKAENVENLDKKVRDFEYNAAGFMEYLRFKEEFPDVESAKVNGGKKPKVEDSFGHEHNVPTKKRTRLDDSKLPLTADEAKALEAFERIKRIIYKKISDYPEIKKCWDEATKIVLEKNELTAENYPDLYDKNRNKFYELMRTSEHQKARTIIEDAGFILPEDSKTKAPILAGVDPSIPQTEIKISLDHILEKARGENWRRALDPENLRFEFSMPNTYREIIQARHPELRDDWQLPSDWSFFREKPPQ